MNRTSLRSRRGNEADLPECCVRFPPPQVGTCVFKHTARRDWLRSNWGVLLSSLLLLLSAPFLRADLAFSLTPGVPASGASEVFFTGTLSNTSLSDNLFLNNLQVSFTGTASNDLSVDTNAFFANVPGILLPGETYTDVVFGVIPNSAIPSGDYDGTICIMGGDDIFASNSLASQDFEIVWPPLALTWGSPASIIYGTALSASQLNAAANINGSFAYSPSNGTVLDAGTNLLSVVFTPDDTDDYNNATDTVCLVVLPAPLTVTAANVSRPYGQTNPVFQGTFTGLQNGDNVTANYSCGAGLNSPVGNYNIVPSLNDPGDLQTNYSVTLVNGTFAVNQAAVAISWANPAAITYGTALSATQLDAAAGVPGTFSYSPALGAILNTGTNTLSVSFTPTDNIDYSNATATVSLLVNPPITPEVAGEPLLPAWGVPAMLAGFLVLGFRFLPKPTASQK